MHIDDIIQEIDLLPGMDKFKAFCRRLQLAAENARANSLGRIPLPNLIFAAAPGCGTTPHVRLLADLLKATKLLSFIGEEEYFEWALQEHNDELTLPTWRISAIMFSRRPSHVPTRTSSPETFLYARSRKSSTS